MTHRVMISFGLNGYVSVTSRYPPRSGENSERGNDITDGDGAQIWDKIDDLLAFIKSDPRRSADDWKIMRLPLLLQRKRP